MVKKEEQYRECEECGEPIDSGNPTIRLCKRCAVTLQGQKRRGVFRDSPKDPKKNRKYKGDEGFFDVLYGDDDRDSRKKQKKKRSNGDFQRSNGRDFREKKRGWGDEEFRENYN
jgi:hypothetical protein